MGLGEKVELHCSATGIPTPRNILWIHAGISSGIPTPRNIL